MHRRHYDCTPLSTCTASNSTGCATPSTVLSNFDTPKTGSTLRCCSARSVLKLCGATPPPTPHAAARSNIYQQQVVAHKPPRSPQGQRVVWCCSARSNALLHKQLQDHGKGTGQGSLRMPWPSSHPDCHAASRYCMRVLACWGRRFRKGRPGEEGSVMPSALPLVTPCLTCTSRH